MGQNQNKSETDETLPPFFSSWNAMYAFVLAFLVILILLFYLITIYYS